MRPPTEASQSVRRFAISLRTAGTSSTGTFIAVCVVALIGGFIFRYRFFIGLRLVVLQHAAHALFAPAREVGALAAQRRPRSSSTVMPRP